MTTCKKWDIVLVPFPFTNLFTTKKRPALIISPDDYNNGDDVIILFITSKMNTSKRKGDYHIKNWRDAGLPKPSMTRMKFATIEKSLTIKWIGSIKPADRQNLTTELHSFLMTKMF
jgi:mRNA interferase MazF